MSLDHQLKFGVVGGKTGVNSCCPFEQISGRVIWAARSLQGALLNYSVLHGFLSMQHINLLSPSSGRLNLFQVNCFTPSSGCQCSTQLKQIITCKIKTYAPSGHWDQQSTWCRDPKYNVSWRGSTEGHKCTGTLVQASWYLSSCKQISSVRQQGNKRACYSLTFSLHPSGGAGKARMHTHKHTKQWFLSEFHTAGWVKTCVNLQHQKQTLLLCLNMHVWGQLYQAVRYSRNTCGPTNNSRYIIKVHTTHWKKTSDSFNCCYFI